MLKLEHTTTPFPECIAAAFEQIKTRLLELSERERIDVINELRRRIHEVSPFKDEPIDLVLWVNADQVKGNDYNPNSVAPPEMMLLKESILQDGYTQPIVGWQRDNAGVEIVDGFHRNRVGKECEEVRERVKGYLPVTIINQTREELGDRMASTIRHNRARGKHSVDSMSEIVSELKRRNWSDEKIQKNLGMEPDEVLRLYQISGLTELFAQNDFTQAWEVDDAGDTSDMTFEITDEEQEEAMHS